MKNYLLSVATMTALILLSQSVDSVAKTGSKKTVGNPNVTNIGDGIKFTFQGCSQVVEKETVVCHGNFRSSNGERSFTIHRSDISAPTKITDSSGRSYIANEIKVGGDYLCRESAEYYDSCSYRDIVLVEGVDYKTTFTFTNASLPSPKISLFSIGYFYQQIYYMKYRNILVN
jgi:hypothetical protein